MSPDSVKRICICHGQWSGSSHDFACSPCLNTQMQFTGKNSGPGALATNAKTCLQANSVIVFSL
jgi:hypothetical protein